MKRIIKCTKDAYITNRIIRNSFRATDANTGEAGTLDLFKLANESTIGANNPPYISGTSDPIELSRLLLKFDLNPIRSLTGSNVDITHSSFKCELKMFDVLGGQTLPSNFQVILFPLSKSFDEGIGRDVIAFEDVDACNFITSSISGDTAVTWSQSGANEQGYVGQENIDIITGSTKLGDLFVTQLFTNGNEDLSLDITNIVSATLTQQIPDLGFRLSFSGTHETDDRTRFVKRFASRHGTNTRIHPRIVMSYNDTITDHHNNFFFDTSGSLMLFNSHRGELSNILTNTGQITGSNSLLLTLTSGSVSGTYTKIVTASQLTMGDNSITGIYSATFSLPSNDHLLSSSITNDHSATFTEKWTSLDGSTTFLEKEFVVNRIAPTNFYQNEGKIKINITNMSDAYKQSEVVKFRVFSQDDAFDFKPVRKPIEAKSKVFDRAYWRIRDAISDDVIIDFGNSDDSTRLSTDEGGMFFEVFMQDLDAGRVYAVDILINEHNNDKIFKDVGGHFRVEF